MLSARDIAVISCLALSLTGCERSMGTPDLASTVSVESRDAPWPTFLPLEMILADDPVDIDRATAEILGLQHRVLKLRQRARMMHGPIIEAQQKLMMQQAVKRHAS